MDCEIRIDLDSWLATASPVVVDIGCGDNKADGSIGVDRLALTGVDVVADIEDGLEFLPDSSVDVLLATSVLEHVGNLDLLLREVARVLRPTGRFEVFVPHFSNPYYYSDPTHVRFFGLYSFRYVARGAKRFRRSVPGFYAPSLFWIESEQLVFDSPFPASRNVKKLFGALVNSSARMLEVYEENLCWTVPCYGIRFVLRPL